MKKSRQSQYARTRGIAGWLREGISSASLVLLCVVSAGLLLIALVGAVGADIGPVAMCAGGEGPSLFVAGARTNAIMVVNRVAGEVRGSIPLPAPANGLVASGGALYAAVGGAAGRILELDETTGKTRRTLPAGHTPMAPVVSPDGHMLYVANRFDNAVEAIDLRTGAARLVRVVREPVALALTPDGKRLFAANHLPHVEPFLDDENPDIACEISVIDTASNALLENIRLPNGSQGVRGMAISPDGRYAVVTHILGHYMPPAERLDDGAMNMNALSLLDTQAPGWIETIILDDPGRGAANPWGLAFSADGRRLFVAHAGTHELSIVDFPGLLERLAARPIPTGHYDAEALRLLQGIRRRVELGVNGPRAIAVAGETLYAAGYFSDTVAVADVGTRPANTEVRIVRLEAARTPPTLARLGEQAFNDASRCYQTWQSCATCHPDGRSDVLYWDLLNDGIGNTKNTKSLLMSALTPPVMWRGVRADALTAIYAGFHHIQFAEPANGVAEAILAYLCAMPAVPGPALDAETLEPARTNDTRCAKCHRSGIARGSLTTTARRGKALFEGRAGCAECHPHPTFTTGKQVDPGLGAGVAYDIPSLVEVWRTAPYLHNGDATTLRETIVDFNFMQRRGNTRDLSEDELDELLEYLRSL